MDWLFFFFFPSINAQPALSCSAKGPSHLTGPAFLMRLSVLLTWKCPHQAGKSGGALEKTWHLITHVSSSVSPKQKLSTQTAQVSHTSFNHDFYYQSHRAAPPCQCFLASIQQLSQMAHISSLHAKEQICSHPFCPSLLPHFFPPLHFP